MAKESLTAFLNREIKKKGTSLKEEKAKASKYSSISAAKKAGSLYYTNKKGVVKGCVPSPIPCLLKDEIFVDSIKVIFTCLGRLFDKYEAVNQPDEPPPTIIILLIVI